MITSELERAGWEPYITPSLANDTITIEFYHPDYPTCTLHFIVRILTESASVEIVMTAHDHATNTRKVKKWKGKHIMQNFETMMESAKEWQSVADAYLQQ